GRTGDVKLAGAGFFPASWLKATMTRTSNTARGVRANQRLMTCSPSRASCPLPGRASAWRDPHARSSTRSGPPGPRWRCRRPTGCRAYSVRSRTSGGRLLALVQHFGSRQHDFGAHVEQGEAAEQRDIAQRHDVHRVLEVVGGFHLHLVKGG